ncbi:MAG: TOBE domain-containing protein [Arcobacteraceae bacterium]
MKISARNQLLGKVELIQKGKVNSEVCVKLKSGHIVASVITNDAVDDLELKSTDNVIAFFKSSCVLVSTQTHLNISARNQFNGVVSNILVGEINGLIYIDIGNNDTIVSVITMNSIRALNIKMGINVTAIIKASDVMIAK